MNRDNLTAPELWALLSQTCLLVTGHPVTSVVICDDRRRVRHALLEMLLTVPADVDIACVADELALVDMCSVNKVDAVLVGVHQGTTISDNTISVIAGLHPSPVIIMLGTADDLGLLAAAAARGTHGLLIWDPPTNPSQQPDSAEPINN